MSIFEGDKPGDRGVVYVINEGLVQKIWKVRFEGNSDKIAPDGRLKALVSSKPPLLWVFKGQVDRNKIDEDVKKLHDYYRSLGFFQAHVGRDYEFNEKENWMTLVFYIDEGPRYHVRGIGFVGNKIYPEEALTYNSKLKGGDYFDQNKMNNDLGAIKDLYGSHGYVFCDAVADLQFFEEPGELNLVYQVTEGNQYRIGDISIQIKGDNPHTRYKTILNRLSMRPGDIADIRQFRSTERRLKASGLYNTNPEKGEMPKVVFSPPDSEESVSDDGKKRTGKRQGNPDSFRGQSPDNPPPRKPRVPTSRPLAPATPSAPPAANSPSVLQPAGATPFLQPQPAPRTPYNNAPVPGATLAPPAPVPAPQANPASYDAPSTPSAFVGQPAVRSQSPDPSAGGYGGYGGGYGGAAPINPGPQPYTVNQGASPYGSTNSFAQPPAGGGYGPPMGSTPRGSGPLLQPGSPNGRRLNRADTRSRRCCRRRAIS